MIRNIGKTDKTIRYIIGIIALISGYFLNLWFLYVVAAISIATALVGFCGLYTVLGINTCKTKIPEKKVNKSKD